MYFHGFLYIFRWVSVPELQVQYIPYNMHIILFCFVPYHKIYNNLITTKNKTRTAWLIRGIWYMLDMLFLYQSNKKLLLTVMNIVKFFIEVIFTDTLNRSHTIQIAEPK